MNFYFGEITSSRETRRLVKSEFFYPKKITLDSHSVKISNN
ncbi:Uncharacterized protein cmbei_40023 [Cryptosporidium meleagridis]